MNRRIKAPRILVFSLWILGILLLFAALASYLPVFRFPILSLISLGVPLLLLAYLILTLFFLIITRRLNFLLLLPVLATFLVHGSILRYHPDSGIFPAGDLKVMSFNTRAFNKYQTPDGSGNADEIISFITSQDPDIVCIQEFSYTESSKITQFPYRFIDYPIGEPPRVVTAILSEYPIVNKGTLIFENSVNNAIFADLQIGEDTIRVYSFHLESLRLEPNPEGIIKEAKKNKFKRLGRVFRQQEEQVGQVRAHAAEVNYPKIFCGDLNNSPFSNVYRKMKGDMDDSFREAGSGFGSTFNLSILPMRIDYIFADTSFEVTGHKTYRISLSDHKPIMSSVRFRKDD